MLIIEVFLPIHRRRAHRAPVFADNESFCLTQESFFQRRQRSLNCISSHKLLPGRKRRIHNYILFIYFFVSHQVTWLNCSNTINNCNFNIHDHTNICIWKQMNILIITAHEPGPEKKWVVVGSSKVLMCFSFTNHTIFPRLKNQDSLFGTMPAQAC